MLFLMTTCHLVIVCFLSCILHQVNGLKCYECTLSDEGCEDPRRYQGIQKVDCQYSIYTINWNSKKHENKESFRCLTTIERNSTKSLYTRRCALQEEEIICGRPRILNYFELKKCIMCNHDLSERYRAAWRRYSEQKDSQFLGPKRVHTQVSFTGEAKASQALDA
ncbi:hypothetical protein JTB14_034792 [Gonioctena quinquepunctata]|nr:hypothetical protein JTB14_034792 [Gonioctena quinquepunctata]